MHVRAIGLIAVLVVASVATPAVAASGASTANAQTTAESGAEAGTDAGAKAGAAVTFETTDAAVVDYAVGGETVAESVRVQSESQVDGGLSLSADVGLQAVTGLAGADVSVASETSARTTIETDSGATLSTHENAHGSLVVETDGDSQYVELGIGESASAEATGDGRVLVTTADGTTASVIGVGDADVAVNDAGNVTGTVDGDGRVVVRAYPDGRDETAQAVEDLLASGESAASVYLTGDNSGAVTLDDNTSASVEQQAEGTVELTVERTVNQGTVVVTSVAEETFESAEDVSVTVDGEAAVRAESMAELRQAADGGENSAFLVRGAGDADATVDVLVGVNHFSTRQIQMQDGDSSSDSDGGTNSDDSTSSGDDTGSDDGGQTTESDDGPTSDASDSDDGSGTDGDGPSTSQSDASSTTAAGDGSDVTTDGESSTAADDGTAGADGPGFGALGAVVALLSGGLVARRAR